MLVSTHNKKIKSLYLHIKIYICFFFNLRLEVSKNTKKPIKLRKLGKKKPKKSNREKKPIKSIKILKKPTGSVRFYKFETEKIKPNRTQT